MGNPLRLAGLLLVVFLLVSCSEPVVTVEPGVSQALAERRAALISQLHYGLRFDIPEATDAPISAQLVVSFELADASAPLQLDFRQDEGNTQAVYANGDRVAYEFRNEHIVVPAAGLREGANTLEIHFEAGDSSLNRNPNYLYTLLVPDRARTLFPLFDQPDLKARYDLTLLLPRGWKAMSGGPVAEIVEVGGKTEFRFETTDLISSYLFSFVAGEFESISREVDGREMTLFHRETDPEKLARNLDAIFELHAGAIAWMEDYTGIDYPFTKFDFALIPGHPYGGMEHVGAIQYRADYLLLEEEPTQSALLGRAQLIAHETVHMWFGNLVTMKWFNDVWTKEVFANLMAGKIVNPGFPEVNHELNFLVSHYPAAYAVDRTEGPNPIRQVLPNLNEAGQMYGSIIYHKAPIMMRQLESMLGPDAFREGMRKYLKSFAHGNATWPDLIAILDAATDEDLATWSQVWVNTPGRPQFEIAAGKAAGDVAQLLQEDAMGQGRVWPQQFEVLSLGVDVGSRARLVAAEQSMPMPARFSAPGTLSYLLSSDGYGYGLFPVDMTLFLAWQRLEPVEKGVALVNSYENLLAGNLTDVENYFVLLLDIVASEQNQLLLELALGQLDFTYNSLLDDTARRQHQASLEMTLWQTLLAQSDQGRTKLFFWAYAALASSPPELARLQGIWSGKQTVDKLVLEEEDYMRLAQILAIRLPDESAAIVAQQLANTQNPDRHRRLAFLAPSLAAEEEVRNVFFESLENVENRHTESWVAEALSNLHHPSRVASSEHYLLPTLELLQEIQRTGDIFFPADWLHESLGNHHSASAVAMVRAFLDKRPDYNAQLRMKILQAADPLFRANRIRQAQRDLAAGQ